MSLLNDKQIALVVGGSQGIGLALVKNLLNSTDSKFAAPDCRVVATIRTDNPELDQLQKEFPTRLYIEKLDLAADGGIDAFAKVMAEKYGRLDLYIHNSGVLKETHTTAANPKIDAAEYTQTHLLNTVAPQNCFCALLPLLQQTHELLGGSVKDSRPALLDASQTDDATKVRVLFVSSMLGSITAHCPGYGVPCYSSSKAALNQLCLDLAHYYPYLAISVCHPGYVKTTLSPNGVLTPAESAAGILTTWNQWGFASLAMKAMFAWDGNTIAY